MVAEWVGVFNEVRRKDRDKRMNRKNTITERRSSGWVERRHYFKRLFEQVRIKTLKNDQDNPKVAPVLEKD